MDLYKSESEFLASLDYLCPPVKRVSTKDFYGLSYKAKTRNINYISKNKERNFERQKLRSSSSFIIKKASKIHTIKQYCFSSYTTLQSSNQSFLSLDRTSNRHYHKYKRSIRVIVIPESDQKQTRKLHNKQRHPKIIQSTLSDQDNSIHGKNLYLIVTGRRNKLYEIKSAGSATFTSDQTDNYSKYDDLSIKGLSHVKHLIQSLNMDQKKGKKEHEIEGFTEELHEKGIDPYESEGYRHANPLGNKSRPTNRSRVRIFGQLGLSEDDRYVLRYGATVNEKPVTDFDHLTYDILRPPTPSEGCATQSKDLGGTRDVSAQVSHEKYVNQCSAFTEFLYSKESQGTQVNLNIQAPLRRGHMAMNTFDKDIQCGCTEIVINKTADMTCQESDATSNNSPLLIISVYSKGCQNNIDKSIKCSTDDQQNILSKPKKIAGRIQSMAKTKPDKSSEKTVHVSRKNESKEKKNIAVNNINERQPCSRSSSPIRNTSKPKMQDKQTEKKAYKTQPEAHHDRYRVIKDIKNKISEKERSKSDVAPSTSKFNGSGNKSTSRTSQKTGLPFSRPSSRNKTPSRKSSPTPSEEKGTITEHAKAKKNLVDSYTNKCIEKWNCKNLALANLNSKVAINIEGEKECYDVSFDQSKLSTNVKILKTMKDTASQRSYLCKNVGSQRTCAEMSPSLENLLFLPEKDQSTQQMNKTFSNMQSNESQPIRRISGYSGITIRDSLEISHRREDKHSGLSKDPHHCTSHCNDAMHNAEIITPIKHYTGDDCSICDPVVRDREIRELLGVGNSKCNSSKFPQVYSENFQYPLQCVYRRKCDKTHMEEINLIDDCINSKFYSDENLQNNKIEYLAYDKQVFGEVNPEMEEKSATNQEFLFNKTKRIPMPKPIILSRKQYYKVKRTIQNTINFNIVNQEIIGKPGKYKRDVKMKLTQNNFKVLHFDRAVQTKMPHQEPKNVRKVRYLIRPSRSRVTRLRPRYNCKHNRRYTNPNGTKRQARFSQYNRRPLQQFFYKCRQIQRHYEGTGPNKEYCEEKPKHSHRNHLNTNIKLHQENNKESHVISAQDFEQQTDVITSEDEYGLRHSLNTLYTTNYMISQGYAECNTENNDLLNLEYQPTSKEEFIMNESQRSFSEQCCKQINIGTRYSSLSENCKSYEALKNRVIQRTTLLPELDKLAKDDDQIFGEYKNPVEQYLRQYKTQALQRQYAGCSQNIKEPDHHDIQGNHYVSKLNNEIINMQCSEYHKRVIEFINNDNCDGDIKSPLSESYSRLEEKEPLKSILLYDGECKADSLKKSSKIRTPTIQYTSMAYLTQDDNAKSDVAVFSQSNPSQVQSIKTLFRGARRRKSRSLNLGTSVCSVHAKDESYANTNKSTKFGMSPQNLKTKKPFLKRLISFFIMRSSRTLDLQEPSCIHASNSTGNSYHISSFGGLEMTSSIYDTSASFYSNHSLYPPTSKIKRGFLNYFSCLIANRKT